MLTAYNENESVISAPGQPDSLVWLHSYYDITYHLIKVKENVYSMRYEFLLSSGIIIESSESRLRSSPIGAMKLVEYQYNDQESQQDILGELGGRWVCITSS